MKYLKKYRIFESNEHRFATSDELNTIEDILLGIKDQDYEVEIHRNVNGDNPKLEEESEVCRIYIEKFAIFGFSPERRECSFIPDEEFLSVLQHLVTYVQEIGYDIVIESVLNSEVKDKLSSEEGELTDRDVFLKFGLSNEYYKKRIDYLKIIISYKD